VKKKLILIFCGFAFLMVAFFLGSPFEFLDPASDTVATFAGLLFIILLFIYLFRLAFKIDKKRIKGIAIGLICLFAIPSFILCIETALFNYIKWQDLFIYTNDNGAKVINEWRELSGSIYDYRDRKILGDFGQFRISINWDEKYMHGIWKEYDLRMKSDSVYNGLWKYNELNRAQVTTVDFDKKNKK